MYALSTMTGEYSLKYNKHYIGLVKNNIANNFINFVPRKSAVIISIKLEQTDEVDEIIQASDLDALAYDKQWSQYRIRIKENDLESNIDVLLELVKKAKDSYMS